MKKPYYNQFQRMHMRYNTYTGNVIKFFMKTLQFRRTLLNTNINIKVNAGRI